MSHAALASVLLDPGPSPLPAGRVAPTSGPAGAGSTEVDGLGIEPCLIEFDKRLPSGAAVMGRPLAADEHDRLRKAIGLLRAAAPGMQAEMVDEGIRIVPLSPRPGLVRQSCSFRTAPGLVFLNLHDPLEILDLLCHEYHHLKLFRVQAEAPLMDRPEVPVVAPWRADRRTAEGLLHGTYVFFMCALLLDAVFTRFPPSDRGVLRHVLFRVCVESGRVELRAADPGLTPFGHRLVDEMAERNDAVLDALSVTAPDALAWSRRTVADHMARAGGPERSEPWFLGL